jgi:hypothetical protein
MDISTAIATSRQDRKLIGWWNTHRTILSADEPETLLFSSHVAEHTQWRSQDITYVK